MRIYQCDCCNKVIADPYTVKMKEFYVGVDTDCLNLICSVTMRWIYRSQTVV